MTVSTTTTKNSYSANGTLHSFAYGYKIFANADLQVVVRSSTGAETTKTLDTHYVVTSAGSDSGGNVLFKFNTGTSSDAHYSTTDYRPASGETVVIARALTRTQGTDSGTVTNEPFTGESNRIVLNDNILSFTGTAWTTTFGLYTLGATDLQVKPGYLVKPGGTYGYWLANPSSASDYKYYARKFTTDSTTKTSMTLNAGIALADWQTSGSNAVAALILFESSNNTIYTPSRFYDPTKTTSNFVGNITANTDGQNPFGSQIALYGNTGGSLASTTYTIPIRNADGMILDSTYNDIYVIIRYKGDPTPITAITIAFS